jgi:uroporphyrinogen decarboxylase
MTTPLEAKAGLDVVDLRRRYGHRMGFCGNIDALAWANDQLPALEAQVLRELNAAKGGGYIVQSDHSVPSSVSAERYEFVVKTVPGDREGDRSQVRSRTRTGY